MGHQLFEGRSALDVAHRAVIDVVVGEQLIDHFEPSLVDDLLEHAPQ